MTFAPCLEGDLAQLLEIQEEAFALLDDVSMLRRNSAEMLASCLIPPNFTIGAWEGERLLAFSVLYFPSDAAEDLSLSLRGIETAGMVTANNKLCIVRPECRGRGLQLQLGLRVEEEACKRGVNLLCATASPSNRWSCENLLRQGYRLNRTLNKYGFERHLFYKSLC